MPTIREILRTGRQQLTKFVERPDLDALYILANTLPQEPAWLLAHGEETLRLRQALQFTKNIRRRQRGWPLAYILGQHMFMGHWFQVNPSTLIPRPATEQLVQQVLEDYPNTNLRCLDIGTGSGVIAISLALERSHWYVVAVEPSPRAIETARANARHFKAKIQFHRGRFDRPVATQQFDIVIANMPYLGTREMREPSIRREPRLALDGGSGDGLRTIYTLIDTMRRPQQALYLECLPRQIQSISRRVRQRWPTAHWTPITAGKTRFAIRVTWPST